MTKPTATPQATLDPFYQAILGRKAYDLIALDVNALSSVADYFIICSGKSNRQVTAIAEHVQKELKQKGTLPLSVDGIKEGHWVLLDYGDVIIHIFYEPVRRFYDLESLWIDAKRLPAPEPATEAQLTDQE